MSDQISTDITSATATVTQTSTKTVPATTTTSTRTIELINFTVTDYEIVSDDAYLTDTLTDTITVTTTAPPLTATIVALPSTATEYVTVTVSAPPVCTPSVNMANDGNWTGGVSCDRIGDCTAAWSSNGDAGYMYSNLFNNVTFACTTGAWQLTYEWQAEGPCEFSVYINGQLVDGFAGYTLAVGTTHWANRTALWEAAEVPPHDYYGSVTLEFVVKGFVAPPYDCYTTCLYWGLQAISLESVVAYGVGGSV